MLQQKEVFRILFYEGHRSEKDYQYVPQQAAIVKFLRQGQQNDLITKKLNPEMICGSIMDRIMPQVLFAEHLKDAFGSDIQDEAYREEWIEATVDLFLYGLFVR